MYIAAWYKLQCTGGTTGTAALHTLYTRTSVTRNSYNYLTMLYAVELASRTMYGPQWTVYEPGLDYFVGMEGGAIQGLRINVETLLRRTVSTPKLNNC